MDSNSYAKHPVDDLFKVSMRLWMEAEKLTQDQVASFAQCERSVVTRWLSGRLRTCNIDQWVQIKEKIEPYYNKAREIIRERNLSRLPPALGSPPIDYRGDKLKAALDANYINMEVDQAIEWKNIGEAIIKGKSVAVLNKDEANIFSMLLALSKEELEVIKHCLESGNVIECHRRDENARTSLKKPSGSSPPEAISA